MIIGIISSFFSALWAILFLIALMIALMFELASRISESSDRAISNGRNDACPIGVMPSITHCSICSMRDHCYPNADKESNTYKTVSLVSSMGLAHSEESKGWTNDIDTCPDCYGDDFCDEHDGSNFFAYAEDETYHAYYDEYDRMEESGVDESSNNNNFEF